MKSLVNIQTQLPFPSLLSKKQKKLTVVFWVVIGNPPNVAVPTHFAKVIYGSGGRSDPLINGALGAFVLPNEKIPNTVPLSSFLMPVEDVEKAAGIVLFPDQIKGSNVPKLCDTVKCDMVIRNCWVILLSFSLESVFSLIWLIFCEIVLFSFVSWST